MRFLISAGEASGELYGAQLIAALKRRVPASEFFGVGGEQMRAAGCETIVDSSRLSVVGITEIVSHLPRIYGDFRRLIAEADRRQPGAAVVIDSPAFNFRVAREMHRRRIPVIYYVCPQLWAWRERRVERFHKWIKKALVIFPFEEPWYRERGVDAEYVGHPLADLSPPATTRQEFAAGNGLDPDRPWIALLPGSRAREVQMMLPTLLRALERLPADVRRGHEFVLPVASSLSRAWMQEQVARHSSSEPSPTIRLVADARPALIHARAAVVASGTATVEAALAGAPMVVVYRVSPLTWRLGRGLLRVPFVAMPNLIVGRQIVPELLQSGFTAANVAQELETLLADGPAREKMLSGLAEVRSRLKAGATQPAAERAADAVLRALS
ncbi:MAG TPA: lipid-A-disaccharide synthase [Terriglobales bacterium]|nr:lipid-A-disaccharide synthase [Terriglobales bacterium]